MSREMLNGVLSLLWKAGAIWRLEDSSSFHSHVLSVKPTGSRLGVSAFGFLFFKRIRPSFSTPTNANDYLVGAVAVGLLISALPSVSPLRYAIACISL